MQFTHVYKGFKRVLVECNSVDVNHTLVVDCQRLKTKYTQKLPPNWGILAVNWQ